MIDTSKLNAAIERLEASDRTALGARRTLVTAPAKKAAATADRQRPDARQPVEAAAA